MSGRVGLTLDATVVLIIASTLIPLLVGIVTKMTTRPAVKAILLIILGTVASAIAVSTGADGVAVISKETLIESFHTVVMSIAMYYGVWKPTTVSATINNATAKFGI